MSPNFHATLQLHNSLVDCDRELFRPSKGLASFRVSTEKKLVGLHFFVGDITSVVVLGHFDPLHWAFGSNH